MSGFSGISGWGLLFGDLQVSVVGFEGNMVIFVFVNGEFGSVLEFGDCKVVEQV